MAVAQGSAYCPRCQRDVLVHKTEVGCGMHLLLTVITCGTWALLYVLWMMVFIPLKLAARPITAGGWRCSQCGQRVGARIIG